MADRGGSDAHCLPFWLDAGLKLLQNGFGSLLVTHSLWRRTRGCADGRLGEERDKVLVLLGVHGSSNSEGQSGSSGGLDVPDWP